MAVFGDTLRQARAHKGVTLKEAELKTRMSRHHLLALEEEQFDDLPPLIYQRGIVRNYANYLNLDPVKILSMFDAARGEIPEEKPINNPSEPIGLPSHWAPSFAIIAFLVLMSAVVFAWMYSAYFAPSEATSTPTELIPTVTAVNDGDTIFLPSPTSAPPTQTPSPTAEPTEVVEEIVVEPTEASVEGEAVVEPTEEDVEVVEEVTVEPTAATTGALTFNFRAASYLDSVQVVADGSVVFEGAMEAGGSTGFVSADSFQVYVSDPGSLEIVRESGEFFFMGDTYFELP